MQLKEIQCLPAIITVLLLLSLPAASVESIPVPDIADTLSADMMMAHIHHLADNIGVRPAGTEAEESAADYIFSELEMYGYTPEYSDPFDLHNELQSRNITATLKGENPEAIVIGAHYDSKPPAPGANDNGTGVAVTLELARVMSDVTPPCTVIFAFFGSEEIIDGNSDHHHYGSRAMASDDNFVSGLRAMMSVDMVGVGTQFWVDSMGEADDSWREYMIEVAQSEDVYVYTGETRAWSDHEAFEYAGVPVAWIHWRYDSEYHQATDTSDRIDPDLMMTTARVLTLGVLGVDGTTSVAPRDTFDLRSF